MNSRNCHGCEIEALHVIDQHVSDAGAGDPVPEGECADDDEDDGCGQLYGFGKQTDDIGALDAAIDENPFEDRDDRGDAGRLGHRHDAAIDAAKDDHGDHQRRYAAQVDGDELLARHRRLDRVVLGSREDHDEGNEQHRLDQAGNDAAEEQPRYGFFRDHRIDDHRQAGRNEDAERACGAHRAQREAVVIVARDHGRDEHRADGDGGGDRRAADGREDRAGDDADKREAAARSADPGLRDVDQRPRDPALLHEGGGHDEHRHRQQRFRVEVVDEELRQRDQRGAVVPEQQQRQKAQRQIDRQADQQEDQQKPEGKKGRHMGGSELGCVRRYLSRRTSSSVTSMVAGSKRKRMR